MLFCSEHQTLPGFGNVMQSAGRCCDKCRLMTYGDYKICDACSLALDQCQRCRAPANSGRPLSLVHKVATARFQLHKAIAAAERDFVVSIAAFVAAADDYESALKVADREYNAVRPEAQAGYDQARKEIEARFAPHKQTYEAAASRRERTEEVATRAFFDRIQVIGAAVVARQQRRLRQQQHW